MTTIVRDIFVFVTAAIFVAVAVLVTTGAGAHEFKVGALDIGHPWSRPTPKDANIAGGYLTITNKGKTADRLIGGASPAAGQIEVHEVVDVDGMTKTRPLANGIEIKPGKTVELKPGALSHPAARPQGAIPAWPEDQGHAGVREGRACRDRLQRRGKSRRRRQWRRCSTSTIRGAASRALSGKGSRPRASDRLSADRAMSVSCGGDLRSASCVGRTMPGPSRSAIAGLELIILQRKSSARVLTSVQLEPNVSHHRGQPATITAKKASGLAVRGHDVVRSASRDRAGILCPYTAAYMGARWGQRVFLLADDVICSSGNSPTSPQTARAGRVKRYELPDSAETDLRVRP